MRCKILTEERAVRLLEQGGMALPAGEMFRIYRTRDARLGSAGVMPGSAVEALVSAGKLAKDKTHEARLVWAAPVGRRSEGSQVCMPPKPPALRTRQRRRGLLQKALHGVEDARERQRLAKAAVRFQQDAAHATRGPVRTMNWDFVPNGGRKAGNSGIAGQSDSALAAGANLKALGDILGPDQMGLLQRVLIWEQSASKLHQSLGMRTDKLVEELTAALHQLAWAYDTALRRAG